MTNPLKPVKQLLPVLAALLCLGFNTGAAVLPAEKLLPEDTLAMVTIPDFAKARDIYKNSPQGQFWNDPSLKAFKDKFMDKLKSEYFTPLEHDLGVHFADYLDLPQGQFTVAMTQNGWNGKDKSDQSPGLLVLIDTKEKSAQLRTNLADLKKKWIDAGKTVKTERIRDVEFSVIVLSTNDIPKSLKKPAPDQAGVPEPLENPETAKKNALKKQIYVGQVDSLLILGNSSKDIEKVLAPMSGGSAKTLGEVPAYSASHAAMFREAAAFGWVNAKMLVDILSHMNDGVAETDSASNPFSFKPEKVIAGLGLNGLNTIAFDYLYSNEGLQFNLSLGVPEAGRAGIFKILAGEPKEVSPPPFVPADAVKFQRWRIDGQKTWATLQKMLGDISPQAISTLNFVLSTAESGAKEKDPSFDIKKNLFGNLGDDIITYQKAPKGDSLAELGSPPTMFLIGSPNPEQLGSALKTLATLSGPASTPTEREFLGHKIYSIPIPASPAPKGASSAPRTLSYACSGGYVAITMDNGILEEYLRSSQNQGKTLRETAGLSNAMQKVGGSGTTMFGYSNESESVRALFDVLKKDSNSASLLGSLGSLAAATGLADESKLKEWVDISLLPTYDKIAKYFYFTVYAGGTTADALNFKIFSPVPPQLKK